MNLTPQQQAHPAFASALAIMSGDAKRAAVDPRHKEYEALLRNHDWQYQACDDHAAWKRGHAERAQLMVLQPLIDPNKAIWNRYAPKGMLA
jgi:hypothetical protein